MRCALHKINMPVNMMRQVTLNRHPTTDHGTLGQLTIGGEQFCWTIEPPDRDNQKNYSCIPTGDYVCVWHKSPKYGQVYLVTGVPDRSHVLIHPGNLAGDRKKNYITHSHGCILLGKYTGKLKNQTAVLSSRPTVRLFFEAMEQREFNLIIH